MKEKLAVPLEGTPSVVVTNNGHRMKRARAESEGYRIVDADAIRSADSANAEVNAFQTWRLAIEYLPEARTRPAAVAELLASQTHATLTVESARAFLRGLATEQKEEELKVSNVTDPRAARKAEITGAMKSFNKDRGYHAPKPAPSPKQTSAATVDPVRLKRLAEIRLNALQMGAAGTNAGEMKKLTYALNVHSTTGLPLATVFAQLGVDVAPIIR